MNNSRLPGGLARLARANPVIAEAGRGRAPQAQAQLARILASEREAPSRRWRPRRRRVIAILIVATALTGCGAALRVADPFGFWSSSTPGTARFGVNPAAHAVAPRASGIRCRLAGAKTLTCTPGGRGIRYFMIEARTFAGVPAGFSRASALRDIAKGRAGGQISVRGARVLRADLIAVPASFFPDFRELGRFQTIEAQVGSNGTERIPPHGVPPLIACQQLAAAIDCRTLNGDEATPVGAAVYAATPERDWITVRSPGPKAGFESSQRLIIAVFGHPFTPAEVRLLMDMLRYATVERSGGAIHRGSAPIVRGSASG
jgi:hypothetical protein